MRLASALRGDIRLQVRHGFYAAYMLVSGAYIALLQLLPAGWRETADVLLTFSDPSALGFYFIGGIVLLERGQGVYDSLFVTPLRAEEYIVSKALSLALLSVLSAAAIHVSAFGLTANLTALVAGTALTSVFFTLFGLGVAIRSRTVNGFFLLSSLCSLPFMAPLLGLLGAWDTPLWRLLPTWGSLTLLQAAFEPAAPADVAASCALLVAWIAVAFGWTRHVFRREVLQRIGAGGGR